MRLSKDQDPWCLVTQDEIAEHTVGSIVMQRAYSARALRGSVLMAPADVPVSAEDVVWFEIGSGHPEQTEPLQTPDGPGVFTPCKPSVSMARHDAEFERYTDTLSSLSKARGKRFLTDAELRQYTQAHEGLEAILAWASKHDVCRTQRTTASKSGLPGAGIFAVERDGVVEPLYDWLLLDRVEQASTGLWTGDETTMYRVTAAGPDATVCVGSVIVVQETGRFGLGVHHAKSSVVRGSDVLVVVGTVET